MLLLLALLSTLAHTALCGVYVTHPDGSSAYTAGVSLRVAWRDDSSTPHLWDLGPLTMELYTTDDDHMATLATGINALDRQCDVNLPLSLGSTELSYVIRFVSDNPLITIYTADFNILPPDASPSPSPQVQTLPPPPQLPQAPMNAQPQSYADTSTVTNAPLYRPVLTLVLNHSTILSTLAPTETLVPTTTYYQPGFAPEPMEEADHEDPLKGIAYHRISTAAPMFDGWPGVKAAFLMASFCMLTITLL